MEFEMKYLKSARIFRANILIFMQKWNDLFHTWYLSIISICFIAIFYLLDLFLYNLQTSSKLLSFFSNYSLIINIFFAELFIALIFFDFLAYSFSHLNHFFDDDAWDASWIIQKAMRENPKNDQEIAKLEISALIEHISQFKYDVIELLSKISLTAILFVIYFGLIFCGIARMADYYIVNGLNHNAPIFEYIFFSAMNFSTLGAESGMTNQFLILHIAILEEIFILGLFGITGLTLAFSNVYQMFSLYPMHISAQLRALKLDKHN